MSLDGKIAVVTGASAAGGCGWAIAEALAKAGAKVVVAARRKEALDELAKQTGAIAIACDLTKEDDIRALAKQVEESLGKIDIAINAAGAPGIGLIADSTTEKLQASIDLEYFSCVHFVREMATIMNDGGSIVLFSSITASQPSLPHFAYACAKAATDCLVRYAALEYGPRGIRVNSIQPGPIKTDMAAHLYETPGVEARFAEEVPVRRVGIPEDYADAVLWLVGPCYISGASLPISGGNQLTRMPRMDELPLGFDSYDKDRDVG
jgi:NAD(P)-dependent dehydrogenase (short-subunit alcohol dehydrogenase family)